MKTTVKSADLLDMLNRVKPCIGKQPPYASYYLATIDGHLLVCANGGDSALMGKIKAAITSKGETILPCRAVEFLKSISSSTVTVSTVHKVEERMVKEPGRWVDNQFVQGEEKPQKFHTWMVKLEAGNSHVAYPTLDPKDSPRLPLSLKAMANLEPIVLKDFGAALAEVSYAMAPKSAETILYSVAMAPEAKGIALVASDGYRLAKTIVKGSAPSIASQVCTPDTAHIFAIDGKMVELMQKFGKTRFSYNKKVKEDYVLVFESDGLTVMTRNAGQFPKYQPFIPEHTRRVLSVYTAELKDAIKTAMTAVGSTGAIRLIGKGKTLKVIGLADDTQAEAKITARGRIQQAYQANYLLAVLNRVGEVVEIRHDTGVAEGVFKKAIVKVNGSLHLICARQVEEWTRAEVKPQAQAPAPEVDEEMIGEGEEIPA